jgi:hypothetical protein
MILVYFAAAKAPVRDLFYRSGFYEYVSKSNFYPTIRDAVAIAKKRRSASTLHLLEEMSLGKFRNLLHYTFKMSSCTTSILITVFRIRSDRQRTCKQLYQLEVVGKKFIRSLHVSIFTDLYGLLTFGCISLDLYKTLNIHYLLYIQGILVQFCRSNFLTPDFIILLICCSLLLPLFNELLLFSHFISPGCVHTGLSSDHLCL